MLRRLTGSIRSGDTGQGKSSQTYPKRPPSHADPVQPAAAGAPDRPADETFACNGFKTIPELETFQLSAEYIAPYSLPQEALSFEPDSHTILHVFKNGDKERKLHCNTELREEEKQALRYMQEQAREKDMAFLPSVSVAATRYFSQARGDKQLALALMKRTQEWRLEYFREPMTEDTVLEDMKHGIAYFVGRDKCLRPSLVFRAKRIPAEWHKKGNYSRVLAIVIFCLEYFRRYMVVPGRVEGINVICDLADMGISQVPVSAIRDIHKSMGSHYSGRVFKFYVCNMSWVLKSLVGVVKGIISDRQAQKIIFVNKIEELRQDFALHQLETDLGGSQPVVKEFLPFPLQSGPFQAGYADGPDPSRVRCVHEAITPMGFTGRLWNPKLSAEENAQLEYTEAAYDILSKCLLPIPSNCPRRKSVELNAIKEASPATKEEPSDGFSNVSFNPKVSLDLFTDEAAVSMPSVEEADTILQTTQVKSSSRVFWCFVESQEKPKGCLGCSNPR